MRYLGDKNRFLVEAQKRVRTVAVPRARELGETLARVKWIPDWMRRDGIDTSWLENTRERLVQWLADKRVEDVTLLLDGPGYGCPQGLVALALLGTHRVAAMREVHAFSASAYAVLFQLAQASGELTLPEWDAPRFHRENQWRHDVRPGATLLKGLSNRLRRGAEALFPSHLGEATIACAVAESFVARKVATLPPHLKFWVYNRTRKEFEAIGAGTRFEHMRIGDLVRACASVPHLYAPFVFEGEELVDALWGKDIRPLYRRLRLEAKHAIFCHMQRDGLQDNTLFLKLHPDSNGYRRIGVDFAYFLLGMDNRDIADALRLGFFQLAPIRESELRAAREPFSVKSSDGLLPPG